MNNELLLTLNFRDETIMLSEEILNALGRPKQVQIMINSETKRLAMCPCDLDSEEAVVMPTGNVQQFEIGGRSVLRRIRKAAGWKSDLPRICFGEEIPEHRAVCFDLEYAITIDFTATAVNAITHTGHNTENVSAPGEGVS